MRKMISHGSGEQMLEAFEQKLNMLENSDKPVESATSVEAASEKPKRATHGTAEQMLAAFEKKVDELEGGVDASSKIEAADEIEEDIVEYLAPEDEERYIHTLIGDTNTELEDLDIYDSWTWEYDETNLVLTTVSDSDVEEYTVPRSDLKFDWDKVEEDVQYIIQAITDEEESNDVEDVESAEDVVGATINYDSEDDKSVVIPEYAKTEYYSDAEGSFGGDANDVYSLEDLMIMWNSDHNSDPSMSVYDTFEDWWEDTKRWMKPSSAPEEGEDDEMFTDNDGIFGEPGEIISKRDMRNYYEENYDNDFSLSGFDSFEDWWAATQVSLEPVDDDEDIMSATSIHESSPFYALVAEDGEPILLFEADDLDDANAQVADYNNAYMTNYSAEYDDAVNTEGLDLIGRLSDEGEVEGPTGSSFLEIASKSVPDAGGFYTDYTMYRDKETGEYVFVFGDKDAYTPDQGDFDWSCDTEEQAWEWYNSYTGFADDEDDDIYSAEDIDIEEDMIEWFADGAAIVEDAGWTEDGEIIVTTLPARDIERTAAALISCIEPNGYHVSDWIVNGSNVFIFEVLSSDEYAELAAHYSYIPEDDEIYSATALYQNPYDEDEEVDEDII